MVHQPHCPTQIMVHQPHCPTKTNFYKPQWLVLLLQRWLSTKLIVPPPTETMVYQPHWLFFVLHRQLYINHNGWSSYTDDGFINHNVWSSSYTDDGFINHAVCSSSYKDNGLSTTFVGPPLTQTIIYQPQWLVFLLHRQWFINQCSTQAIVYQPQWMVLLLLHRRWFYQPHWLFPLLRKKWFFNHIGWSSSYTLNALSTILLGPPPAYTTVNQQRWSFFFLNRKRLRYIVCFHPCTDKVLSATVPRFIPFISIEAHSNTFSKDSKRLSTFF